MQKQAAVCIAILLGLAVTADASPNQLPSARYAQHIQDDALRNQPVKGVSVIPMDPADVTAGAAIYRHNCVSCHGPNGEGHSVGSILDPNPTNFGTGVFRYGSDDARLFTTCYLGARHWSKAPPTSGMFGYKGKLSKAQILQVLGYLKHDLIGKPVPQR